MRERKIVAALGGLKEEDGEDGDQGLQGVAEAGLDGDEVVDRRLDEEDSSEEPRSGDAALE